MKNKKQEKNYKNISKNSKIKTKIKFEFMLFSLKIIYIKSFLKFFKLSSSELRFKSLEIYNNYYFNA